MAQLECALRGSASQILGDIENKVLGGSISATKEGGSDFSVGDCYCAVRVYERYSMIGSNRVSMTVTLLQGGGRTMLSAITSGGSQAVLFKVNTFGEEAFLDTIRGVIDKYRA